MATLNIPKVWPVEDSDGVPNTGAHTPSTVALPRNELSIADVEFSSSQRLAAPQLRPITPLSQRLATAERIPLFYGLSRGESETIVGSAQERSIPIHCTIFSDGDPARAVFVLLSGRVKMTQRSPSGEEIILRVKGTGEVVGALGFASGSQHGLTAHALEPCRMLAWDVGTFERFLAQFPGLRRNVLYVLAEGLRTIEERFLQLATEQVAPRLARMLTRLLEQNDLAARTGGSIELSREELAQMIGTSVFTVSRLLSEWEKRDIIQAQRRGVRVKKPRALSALAESGGESF
jgi:CRP/FNR family transcriptional regulator, nitrogen oxide reductase regulator